MIYNLMTCQGFQVFGGALMGGNLIDHSCNFTWSMDLFIIAIAFFLPFIIRKQCADGVLAGTNFNHIASLSIGLVSTVMAITFIATPRWVLLIGLAGVLIGGFGVGLVSSTSEDAGNYGSGGDYT